jgi:hypothetical protein
VPPRNERRCVGTHGRPCISRNKAQLDLPEILLAQCISWVFRGGAYGGGPPPFGRRMLHPVRPSQSLVTFAVDPQPDFVFDEKSRVAICRKSSLEFERVFFERDFEAPVPGDEGAYE